MNDSMHTQQSSVKGVHAPLWYDDLDGTWKAGSRPASPLPCQRVKFWNVALAVPVALLGYQMLLWAAELGGMRLGLPTAVTLLTGLALFWAALCLAGER